MPFFNLFLREMYFFKSRFINFIIVEGNAYWARLLGLFCWYSISIDPVSTQKPEEPLFLSPQVWESQEIVKKKVNFQFKHGKKYWMRNDFLSFYCNIFLSHCVQKLGVITVETCTYTHCTPVPYSTV